MANVDVRLARKNPATKSCKYEEIPNLMTPGDVITTDTNYMRYIVYIYQFNWT